MPTTVPPWPVHTWLAPLLVRAPFPVQGACSSFTSEPVPQGPWGWGGGVEVPEVRGASFPIIASTWLDDGTPRDGLQVLGGK